MNALGYLTLVLSLSGCLTVDSPVEIQTRPTQRPELIVPPVDELNLRSVEWVILTEENFQEKLDELENRGESAVFFALTSQGYEQLSLNISDIRAMIQQQQAVIAAYRNYQESTTTLR